MRRFTNYAHQDYNIMDAEDMDELLFSAFDRSLGDQTRERLRTQFENYEYYDGKQHKDAYGNLVRGEELERPPGLDYDPTRYATNYFKAVIDRKARWQMGGKHGVRAPRKTIDSVEERTKPDYKPSPEQQKSDEKAENKEKLIQDLWKQNKMRDRLIQAARDRLIADRVVCKIVFNSKTGKLHWVWRPDSEFIPIFSDDDFEELIMCHFVKPKTVEIDGKDEEAVQIQTYRMFDDMCYLSEAVYLTEDLELYEQITPAEKVDNTITDNGRLYAPLNLDFIPVVMFPVSELLAEESGEGEISHLREQNDILNRMNEDAIDSLQFEMFPMTGVFNAPPGTAEKMEVAPGSVVEATGKAEGSSPDIKKIESHFAWKEAFKDQYARVKGAMHEVSGLPQIVPQELNFGGLNGDALQILFHDIISDTEEHWLVWEYGLKELHEKSIRYLQRRTDAPKFAYDKGVVKSIDDYETEINFVLPLPDNRADLVSLLSDEVSNEFESRAGAIKRLGFEDVREKMEEIRNEKMEDDKSEDPYQMYADDDDNDEDDESAEENAEVQKALDMTAEEVKASDKVWYSDNGEKRMICPRCGGSGKVTSDKTQETMTCPRCQGSGEIDVRKR